LIARLREQGIASEHVLERIAVRGACSSTAWRALPEDTAADWPRPTISQPYIVARMTEALLEGGTPQFLEIGRLRLPDVRACRWSSLYTASSASRRCSACAGLRELKLGNVHLRHGDGFEAGRLRTVRRDHHAAAACSVPTTLLEQARRWRLILPVGPIASSSYCR
jgi:protein-L-isoaspartate(D-aspartate) O-methyltransferase